MAEEMLEITEDTCPKCGSARICNGGSRDGTHFEDTEVTRRTICQNCLFSFFREYTYEFRSVRWFDKKSDMFIIASKGTRAEDGMYYAKTTEEKVERIKSRFEILDL